MTTCGLDNVGALPRAMGLHGSYMFLRADELRTSRSPGCGRVPSDRQRSTRTPRRVHNSDECRKGRLELVDRTLNVAQVELEAPLLDHVNLGWPLWDVGSRVDTDAGEVYAARCRRRAA